MKNVTNEEKVKWLKENCCYLKNDTELVIDLSNLDFGDADLNFSGVAAKDIDNSKQKAQVIYNSSQEASMSIWNTIQKATDSISNKNQIIGTTLECKTKTELIEIIKELKGDK